MAAGDVPLALKEDTQEDKPYVVIATPKGRKSTYMLEQELRIPDRFVGSGIWHNICEGQDL